MPKQYKYRESFTFDGKRYEIRANTKEELARKKVNKLRDLEEGRIIVDQFYVR